MKFNQRFLAELINNARPNLQMRFPGSGMVLPSVLLWVWVYEERLRLNLRSDKKSAMISNFKLLHMTGEAGGGHCS